MLLFFWFVRNSLSERLNPQSSLLFFLQSMDAVFNKLRNLDAYPKINEDFYRRTFSGGLITLASSFIMLFLFFSELSMFWCSSRPPPPPPESIVYPSSVIWLMGLLLVWICVYIWKLWDDAIWCCSCRCCCFYCYAIAFPLCILMAGQQAKEVLLENPFRWKKKKKKEHDLIHIEVGHEHSTGSLMCLKSDSCNFRPMSTITH